MTTTSDSVPTTTVLVHATNTDSPLRTSGVTENITTESNNNNSTKDMNDTKELENGEVSGLKNGLKNGSGNSMTAQSMDDILTYDGKEVEYSLLRPENSGLSWYIMRILCPCRKTRPTFIKTETQDNEEKKDNIEDADIAMADVNDNVGEDKQDDDNVADENEDSSDKQDNGDAPKDEVEVEEQINTETQTVDEIKTEEASTEEVDKVDDAVVEDILADVTKINKDNVDDNVDNTSAKLKVDENGENNKNEEEERKSEEMSAVEELDQVVNAEDIEIDEELPEEKNEDEEYISQTTDNEPVPADNSDELAVTPTEAILNHTTGQAPISPLNVQNEDAEGEVDQEVEMPPAMAIQEHLFGSQPPEPLSTTDVDDLHSQLASTLCLQMPSNDDTEPSMATTSVDIAAEMEMLVKQRIDSQAPGAINAVEQESGNEDEVKAKCAEKRLFVIRELIETEKDYVKDLKSIIEGYMGYMAENPLPGEMEGKDKIVFGNIHQIYDFHNETFSAEIEKCIDDNGTRLGSLFNRYERRLYMYVKYCENKPKSEYIVAEYADTYFEEIRQKLGHRLQLPDLLIKPVQRIMKYQLLLKDILKYTERAGDPTEQLKKALNVMCVVPKAANDMMNVGRLQGFDGKITAQGKLLLQDTVMVAEMTPGSKEQLKFKERRVFLFEQIVIVSEMLERRKGNLSNPGYIFKHSIKVNKMAMRIDKEPLKFTLVDGTPGSNLRLMIQAPDEETKGTWITQIQSILDMQGDFLKALQSPIAYMSKMQK